MIDDQYAHGFEKWEKRFAVMPADDLAFGDQPTREVQLAAQYYRATFGDHPALTVDLGAGDGRNTLFLAEQGFDVHAIEGAPSGAERLRQRLENAQLNAKVITADLRTFELPAQIDLLVASYIIHMLPEPYRVLRGWMEAIRADGVAMIATRGRLSFDPDFYWFPQVFELKHLFKNAGWRIIHCREEENIHPEYDTFRQTVVVAQKPS